MIAKEDVANHIANQQVSMSTLPHTMNVELHSGTKLHLGIEL